MKFPPEYIYSQKIVIINCLYLINFMAVACIEMYIRNFASFEPLKNYLKRKILQGNE